MTQWLWRINETINGFVWGPVMLAIFLLVGLWISLRTGFFQLRHMGLWLKETIVSAFRRKEVRKTKDPHSISQFQALTTALAATIGTGSLAGVATAIFWGGPGAVFWMWVSAFLGMMTNFAEKTLGVYYRYKNEKGDWIGGAMVYMEKGLHCRPLALLFAAFCMLASFGIGNMTQANSISSALNHTWGVPPLATGLILALLVGLVILGGLKRIASVTEKVVPFMALFYLAGGMVVLVCFAERIPAAFASILQGAWDWKAAGGGVLGYTMAQSMRFGIARGVFSNEAGLGSSVMVHSASDVKEPVVQGMWGVFEVFTDTLVVCTLTALVILVSGVFDPSAALAQIARAAADPAYVIPESMSGVPLTAEAFSTVFGSFGQIFVVVAIVLFAYATLVSWSYYGEKSVAYLTGTDRYAPLYKMVFLAVIVLGCVSELNLVWNISDTFNGLMAVPNLMAVALLSPRVFSLTKDYLKRRKEGKKTGKMPEMKKSF